MTPTKCLDKLPVMTKPHLPQDHPHLDPAPAEHRGEDTQGGTPRWDDVYARRPEWDIGRPQPAFLALAEAGVIRGRVLDVGCGTGDHVLMCAARGLDATGIDVSAGALETARLKARERGLSARFLLHDACRLPELGESFDTVLDSGLFVHVIEEDGGREAYVDGLRTVVPPDGRYFMLCFRAQGGRHRGLTPEEIATAFADGWQVDSIEPVTLDGATTPGGIPAWRVAVTRR